MHLLFASLPLSILQSVHPGSEAASSGFVHMPTDDPGLEPKMPETVQVLLDEVRKCEVLQKTFVGTDCDEHYTEKLNLAQNAFDTAFGKWKAKISVHKERKRKNVDGLLTLGCYGDPDEIQKFLFHASASVLEPLDLRELSFSICSATGMDGFPPTMKLFFCFVLFCFNDSELFFFFLAPKVMCPWG